MKTDKTQIKKPPLGVMPKQIWIETITNRRFEDLQRAIGEYLNQGLIIKPEWIEEYNELVKE